MVGVGWPAVAAVAGRHPSSQQVDDLGRRVTTGRRSFFAALSRRGASATSGRLDPSRLGTPLH